MSALANDRFLRALRREAVDRTPVWIMRQAGRYLPEYRATRQRAGDFLTLCKTPELACEVTLQPLARFPLDAAILFSDILTIPDAMGLGLTLDEGVGPRFTHPVREVADIARLGVPDPEVELRYVMDAVRLIKRELHARVPLIGFAGSPWTLATYMIEGGGGDRDFKRAKQWLYARPAELHRLLELLTAAVIEYLRAQRAAGADALMVFDTWGGALAAAAYREFSLAYMARIVAALGEAVPTILFTKGGGPWLEHIAATGCSAVGCDWTVDLGDARRRIGARCAVQGNLDPAVLRAPIPVIEREVAATLASYGAGPGHVFNLGHGITPDIDPAHVAALVAAVQRGI
ncbi:MAG TPA: uroporphyrinogen decarboxylase [Gammaproteobacteria bacterium]|nr:uroporphyrinogen decarboxylase [Gammaproteobacteria bacterium]